MQFFPEVVSSEAASRYNGENLMISEATYFECKKIFRKLFWYLAWSETAILKKFILRYFQIISSIVCTFYTLLYKAKLISLPPITLRKSIILKTTRMTSIQIQRYNAKDTEFHHPCFCEAPCIFSYLIEGSTSISNCLAWSQSKSMVKDLVWTKGEH